MPRWAGGRPYTQATGLDGTWPNDTDGDAAESLLVAQTTREGAAESQRGLRGPGVLVRSVGVGDDDASGPQVDRCAAARRDLCWADGGASAGVGRRRAAGVDHADHRRDARVGAFRQRASGGNLQARVQLSPGLLLSAANHRRDDRKPSARGPATAPITTPPPINRSTPSHSLPRQ